MANKTKKVVLEEEELEIITEDEENEEELVIFEENLHTIYIFEEIQDSTALSVIQMLNIMENEEKCEEMTMYINSAGGSAMSAFAICDEMLSCKKPIKTIAIGNIMSAAVPILACGTKGMRFSFPHVLAMLHYPSVSQELVTTEGSRQLTNALDLITRYMVDFISRLSTATQRKKIWNILKANTDCYTDAQTLLELGIVDNIINVGGKNA